MTIEIGFFADSTKSEKNVFNLFYLWVFFYLDNN